jgi:putative SOS response-associated peptidase YedK
VQRWRRPRAGHDALGNAATAAHKRAAGTNIRNTSSTHWRAWLKPESRCLVPANSFAEYAQPNPGTRNKDVVWFALDEDRPLYRLSPDVASLIQATLANR